jgi:pimeloyl-ACP methyl ester carboxylesterase
MIKKSWRRYGLAFSTIAAICGGLWGYTSWRVCHAEARYPPAGDFVTVDGVRLHYVRQGEGSTVVLIHGDGGSIYDWTMSVFDTLAQPYDMIAFDRPGLGYSERPPDGASPFVQARLLHDATKALDVTSPLLVGHSRGGNVALAYALTYPDEISGVVTLAAAPYGGTVAWHNRLLTLPILGPLLAHTVYVPFGRPTVEAGLNVAFSPDATVPQAYLEVYAAYELRPKQLLAHAEDQVYGAPITQAMAERYDELDVPLVIVHGTADRNVPVEQARHLHQVTPQSTLIEVPGAGHELMFLHQETVLEAIRYILR